MIQLKILIITAAAIWLGMYVRHMYLCWKDSREMWRKWEKRKAELDKKHHEMLLQAFEKAIPFIIDKIKSNAGRS